MNITGATSASYTTPATVAGDNNATFDVIVSNAVGNVTSASATLTLNFPPTIVTPPASTTVNLGQTVTFSVVATGVGPFTYQWQKNSGSGAVNITGATSANYTTPATVAGDNNATFDVIVSNAAGSTTSASATLTLNFPPTITVPPANATVNLGATATFSVVAASVGPFTYQWQKNSGTGAVNITGATNSSYTTPATVAGDNNAMFDVIVSNAAGSTTSASATLTLNFPPTIATPPASTTVNLGATATFNVVASGVGPFTYQWQKNSGTGAVNITGATNSSYTTPATVAGDNNATFDVIVSNAVGSVTSASATLTLNFPPTVTVPPASTTVNLGATATFNVTASGVGPFTYQWQKNSGSGAASITGATSASYTTPATVAGDNNATFDVMVSNAAGSITSASATLTLNFPPTITVPPASTTVNLGAPATFSVAASGTAPFTYKCQKYSGTGAANIPGATSSSYTTPATVAGDNNATFDVIVSNAAGSTMSASATLTLNFPPTITVPPASTTVTLGAPATFSVGVSGVGSFTYQWQENSANIAGGTSASYTTPATVAGDNNATFDVVVSNAVGSTTSASATLTLNFPPTITVPPASTTMNLGVTATFNVTVSGTGPFTYQWQKNSGSGAVNVTGATSASYTTPATVAGDNNATFDVMVSNAAGSTTSASATLTVITSQTLVSIAVTPPTVSIEQDNTQALIATGTYNDGTTQDLTDMTTWTSSNSSAASMVLMGTVRGVSVGSTTITATLGSISGSATLTVVPGNPQSGPCLNAAVGTNWTCVQVEQTEGIANPYPVALPSNVTAGNMMVANCWVWTNGGTITSMSVSDNINGPYTNIVPPVLWDSGQNVDAIYWFPSNVASGADTVSITSVATNVTTQGCTVVEWHDSAGTPAVDAAAPTIVGTTPATDCYDDPCVLSTPLTTTADGDLIFGWTDFIHANMGSGPAFYLLDGEDAEANQQTRAGPQVIAATINSGLSPYMISGVAFKANSASSPSLQSITLTPPVASIAAGTVQTFIATGKYSNGSTQNLTDSVTWTSSNHAAATVNADGLVTGMGVGTSTIQASSLGVGGMATLIVALSPSISAQPTSQSVISGQTATFTVTATGTGPLSYQWQENGSPIVGATSTSYTMPSTSISDDGYQFTVIVTNAVGIVASNSASLTVLPPVAGTTFYIDFQSGSDSGSGTSKSAPWKYAPGMNGCAANCASYVVQPGDTFIFKGGVTWDATSFPWTIGSSGSSANYVTYTTDHSWFAGSNYAQPVFDANHTQPAGGMLQADGQSYLVVNDLDFINMATAEIANGVEAVIFTDTHDISFTNDTFAPECWIAIYFRWETPGAYRNITIDHNDISHAGSGLWSGTYASAAPGNIQVDGVTFSNNTEHDFSSQIGGAIHGDGVHFFNTPDSDGTQNFTNVEIYNNQWYGSFGRTFGTSGAMTGYVFMEDGVISPLVYNNIFTYSDIPSVDNIMQAEIYINPDGNSNGTGAQIYNNSFFGTNPGMSAGFDTTTMPNVVLKNNIFSSMEYAINLEQTEASIGFSSDYDDYDSVQNVGAIAGNSYPALTDWQSIFPASSYDPHGMNLPPTWVSAPLDLHLQQGSAMRGAATNLTSLGVPQLDFDHDGAQRPGGSSAWDLGAYIYQTVPGATAPTITTEPADQTINAGQSATFMVAAVGTAPLDFQWQKNGATIAGATSSMYTTPLASGADNGAQYTVLVSNLLATVVSNPATLGVTGPPVITMQPASAAVPVSQPATFDVVADTATAPLSYQWQRNGTDIAGATSSTFTLPTTAFSDNGAIFDVNVSNSAGNVTSITATLTVNPVQTTDVLTYHNDNSRTGQNLSETILTPGGVNAANFGKLGFFPVDGPVDAQPLYLSNVIIPGNGTHNVLYVATENDSVYAFDATTGQILWQVSMLGPGEVPSDDHGCSEVSPAIGITGTPVIDNALGVMYLVSMSKDGAGSYHQRFHALDVTTGIDGGPTEIQASFPGTGDNSDGQNVNFDPAQYTERAGLLLWNGTVYTTFASHCGQTPDTGWILAFDEDSLDITNVLDVTPNGTGGAISMSGGGPRCGRLGEHLFPRRNGDV